jgi:hypothetical protein
VAFIVTLLTDAIIADLTDALNQPDNSGSTLVRLGPLQEDPENYKNPILVYENDPLQPDSWPHEQYREPLPNSPFTTRLFPGNFEIGGTELYYRRFLIELNLYLTRKGLNRSEAKATIDLVHGRCVNALRMSTRIPGLADEFKERVAMPPRNGVVKSRMLLKGGPPTDWIGDGKIWFQVLTSLP